VTGAGGAPGAGSGPDAGSEARARAEDLFAKGLDAHDRGELATAESYYRRAIEADPSFAIAHNNLGMICIDMGRHEDAVREFQAALELDPTHAEAHNNLGYLYRRLADHGQAALHYARFLTLSPQVEDGPKMREWIKTVTGRSPEDLLAASTAPAAGGEPPAATEPAPSEAPPTSAPPPSPAAPDFDLSGLAGAEALEGTGRGAEATPSVETTPPFLPGETPPPGAGDEAPDAGGAAPDAGDEAPDLGWLGDVGSQPATAGPQPAGPGAETPEATIQTGPPATSLEEAVSLFRDGEVETALAACTALLAADAGDAGANLLAGRCQMRLGNYPQAVVFCLRATQAAPSDSEAFYFLGQAYEKRGILDEAREAYTRCVEVAPEGARAKKLREWMDRVQARSMTGSIKPGAGARCDYCLQVFPPDELQSHQGKRACARCLATLQPDQAPPDAAEAKAPERGKSKRVPAHLAGRPKRGRRALLTVLLVLALLAGGVYALYRQGLLPEEVEEGVRNFLLDVGLGKTEPKPRSVPTPAPVGPTPTPVGPTPTPVGPTFIPSGLATLAFVGSPPGRAQPLAPYGYLPKVEGRNVKAEPVPAGRVEFKLLEGPEGLSVDPATGYVAWTPGLGEGRARSAPPAEVEVAISARTGRAKASQRWTVRLAFPVERLSTLEGAAGLHERVALCASDLNGDGRADLVLGGGEVRAGRVRVRYSTDEKGSFSSPETLELVGRARADLAGNKQTGLAAFDWMREALESAGRCGALACADFTGDGRADLAAFDWARGRLHIYAQKKGGGLDPTPVQTLEAPRGVDECLAAEGALSAVSSLNGEYVYYTVEKDGLERAWGYSLTCSAKVPLYLRWIGTTHYVFAPQPDGFETARLCETCSSLKPYSPTWDLGFPVAMEGGDFDGDGDPKLALLNRAGRLYRIPFLRDVEAAQPVPMAVAEGLPAPAALAAADLNGDKLDDLVVAGGDKLIVLLSCGNGKFLRAAEAPFKGATDRFVLADFTGDGRVEAAALDAAGALGVFKLGEKPIPPPARPEPVKPPEPEAKPAPKAPAAPPPPVSPPAEGDGP